MALDTRGIQTRRLPATHDTSSRKLPKNLFARTIPQVITCCTHQAYPEEHQTCGLKEVEAELIAKLLGENNEGHENEWIIKNVENLFKLGVLSACKFEQSRRLRDLDEAIDVLKRVLEEVPATEPTKETAIRTHLHRCLALKVGEINDLYTIDDLVRTGQQVLAAYPDGESDWWSVRYHHDTVLFRRYRQWGDARLLQEAMQFQMRAVTAVGESHPFRVCMLHLLVEIFSARYLMTHSVDDIEKAIEYGYQAEAARSSTSKSFLVNLVMCLHMHYVHTRYLLSLDEAFRLSANFGNFGELTWDLDVLCCARHAVLMSKFARDKAQDLETAMKYLKDAIDITGNAIDLYSEYDHLNDFYRRRELYNRYGSSLTMRLKMAWEDPNNASTKLETFWQFQTADSAASFTEVATIESDVPCKRGERPEENPSFARYLSDYALGLEVRYITQKNSNDPAAAKSLDKAIDAATRAYRETEVSSLFMGERMVYLGTLLHQKFLDYGQHECYVKAKQHFKQAAWWTSASPRSRISAAQLVARCLLADEEWEEADEVMSMAIDLLPEVSTASLTMEDQKDVLRELNGLGNLAAAAAIRHALPAVAALGRLEATRCIMSEISMRSRGDLDLLRKEEPYTAEKYERLQKQALQNFRNREISGNYLAQSYDRKHVFTVLAELKRYINSRPRLSKFQLPLSASELLALGDQGSIVTFVVEEVGSYAIIVDASGCRCLVLEKMNYGMTQKMMICIAANDEHFGRHAVPRIKSPSSVDLGKALQWLWDAAVQDVVAQLDLSQTRRVWWVTNGVLGRAPFHAAGYHHPGSLDNTLSHVESSYISSFKALKFARDRAMKRLSTERLLLVTMSTTPGHHRSIETRPEMEAVTSAFGHSVTHLEQPTPEEVLHHLPSHSVVHFACHGISVESDPQQSGLLLAESGKTAVLTIADLERIDVSTMGIAYLSACSTAEIGGGSLEDEAIHLANSFQALGFPHVIGTLWDAEDNVAGEVARAFYELLAQKSDEPTADSPKNDPAGALHKALLGVREKYRKGKDVRLWAPYIHVGA